MKEIKESITILSVYDIQEVIKIRYSDAEKALGTQGLSVELVFNKKRIFSKDLYNWILEE